MQRRSPYERSLSKFTQAGPDDCWLWTASLDGKGYGQIGSGGRGSPARAHRVVYEALVGPIPDGHDLDHLCRNRACVNPRHMEPVTRRENLARGAGSGGALWTAPTHCKHGHEFTPANTYVWLGVSGHRQCRICMAVSAKRAGETRRAAMRVTRDG